MSQHVRATDRKKYIIGHLTQFECVLTTLTDMYRAACRRDGIDLSYDVFWQLAYILARLIFFPPFLKQFIEIIYPGSTFEFHLFIIEILTKSFRNCFGFSFLILHCIFNFMISILIID